MLVCLATRTATASASICGLGTSVPSAIFFFMCVHSRGPTYIELGVIRIIFCRSNNGLLKIAVECL